MNGIERNWRNISRLRRGIIGKAVSVYEHQRDFAAKAPKIYRGRVGRRRDVFVSAGVDYSDIWTPSEALRQRPNEIT